MISKLFWMKTNLRAKSYGSKIDQIKELVKQLVGGWVKAGWHISHRFLLQRIRGVRPGAAAGGVVGGLGAFGALASQPPTSRHARVWTWRDLIGSLHSPAKLVSEREIEVSISQRLVLSIDLFLFLCFNVFVFPFIFLFSSLFLAFLPIPSFLPSFLSLHSFLLFSRDVLFLIPPKCLLHHGRI